jgi:hypothetical protein
MSRESSPPLEVTPLPAPTALDRLGLDMWFMVSDVERAEPPKTPVQADPLVHLPSGAEVRAALAQLRAAAPLLRGAARAAFLPLPRKEVLDPDAIPDPEPSATTTQIHNPYLPEKRFRIARSPLALSLPLTAADLDREIEPPGRHDWLTLYLATLALFIWAAVLFTALDSGLVAQVWAEGFNWRVLPAAITDPVRTWAVVDDVVGIAGVCNGGVCQWTPLV